jgi:hypothetical protein
LTRGFPPFLPREVWLFQASSKPERKLGANANWLELKEFSIRLLWHLPALADAIMTVAASRLSSFSCKVGKILLFAALGTELKGSGETGRGAKPCFQFTLLWLICPVLYLPSKRKIVLAVLSRMLSSSAMERFLM